MALVNPNIAMSFRQPDIQAPNALAQFAQIQQIQSGRQAQELNALKMQEAQAAMEERNALRQLNPASADYENQLFKVNPQLGIAYRKERAAALASDAAAKASAATATKAEFELKTKQRKFVEDLKRGLSANPSDANIIAFGEDAVLQGLYTKEQAERTVQQFLAIPVADRQRIFAQAGATAGELRPISVGNSLMTPQGQVLATAPRQSQLLTPEEEAQKARVAAAGRAPAQPVAPTITQIQDPTNPAQMITIDARSYRGGGIGSPGVYGTTGKTAPVAAAEQKRVEGATQAQDILDTLRASYDELDRLRAVPSDQRGALSNAIAYVASTGVGQVAGRFAGTKEQTQRDIIASARNQMLNAIKNATGMSAQQLNSNVEFRSWLEALTDPTRSIEANRGILDNMEKFIASGGKYSAKKGGGDNTPAASNVAQERANANAAIAAGAPAAAVRARFKEKTGQEL
jgi:hypothetical protein